MNGKKINIVVFLLIYAFAWCHAGEYKSYGNDYLNLLQGPGAELYGISYGLMQSGGENAVLNPAGLVSDSGKPLYLYYSSWFGSQVSAASGAYSFSYKNRPIGISFSRVGVDDIPDSRQALLDYGQDGIPGTGDSGEGNGILDENEIIDYDGITFISTSNYVFHIGTPVLTRGSWSVGFSAGIMIADLVDVTGVGLTFNLAVQQKGSYVESIYALKNVPSALMVYNRGTSEYYAPSLKAGWLFPFSAGPLRMLPGLNVAVSVFQDQQNSLISLGAPGAVDISPFIRVEYKEFLSAGIGYQISNGLYGGLELILKNIDISYSFRPSLQNELGGSHLIALRLSPNIVR